jgi:hypothetical protein
MQVAGWRRCESARHTTILVACTATRRPTPRS